MCNIRLNHLQKSVHKKEDINIYDPKMENLSEKE